MALFGGHLMNKILVLGGTGFVGRHLCERLVERNGGGGGLIRVPSRRPARAKHIQMLPTVELVQADVHDPAQLRRLVAGCDAVINLVAILHGRAADFERVHVALPRQLAQVCAEQGVRRLLHVSALGVGEGAPSHYLRSKTEGEAVLRAQSGLDLTVLRPSVIFGAEDRFLNLFAALQRVFPVVPLAGARARFQPVWVGDVAQALVHALDRPDSIGQTYECAGPQVYTLAELVRLAGELSGHPRPIVPLPEVLGWLQALVLECLPGEPLMSRDNIASMRVPNVASGRLPGLQALGIAPVDLPSVAAGYLGGREPRSRYLQYRAFARRG
ncbi:MAG: complex I NDUFA9 subunit family protein [Caldimonas sp.]|nr:MAG: complex I NDUFA9 subunit family protein [Caldimonas sp.]